MPAQVMPVICEPIPRHFTTELLFDSRETSSPDFMSAAARATSNNKAQARDQGRVLLVTDEPAAAAYGAALEEAGFTVVGVAGGAAALVSLRRTRPHIVILDLNLKGIGAHELVTSMARMQDSVTVLLIGEVATTAARRGEAIKLGAFDYFQMPAEMALLI